MKTHLRRLEPRVVVRERVVMPVRAIPSASRTLCQTTTSTLDNTCRKELSSLTVSNFLL